MAGLTTFKAIVSANINISGAQAATGLPQGAGNGIVANLTQTFAQTVANNLAFGSDEGYVLLLSIAASGTATVNLQSFADVGGQGTAAIVRMKGYVLHLLGTNELAPDNVTAGNACSGVTLAAGASNGFSLNLGGTSPTLTINNASCLLYTDGSAAGLGTISSSHENITITNLDSVNAAKVLLAFWGGST